MEKFVLTKKKKKQLKDLVVNLRALVKEGDLEELEFLQQELYSLLDDVSKWIDKW